MPSSSLTLTAALVAVTAGAGALVASPALAKHGGDRRPGQGPHRPAPPPLAQPGNPLPGIGVVTPDQPTGAPQRQPGPDSRQARAPEPGDDNASPRVAGRDTWLSPGVRRGRSFRVSCDFVKAGMFDPIVAPGVEPAGHDHQFFGALSINASSTPADLVTANTGRDSTSCAQTRDGSAYWMPALQIADDPDNPVAVEPDEIRVRYAAPRGQRVRAFPAGFTLIAGDKSATTLQQNAGWRCEFDAPRTPLEEAPTGCDPDEAIVRVVRFPNCWDGKNLGSPTQDHMAYRTGRACPATHPVALPEMVQEVFWVDDGEDHVYSLASGSTAGLHADFMNGWNQRALRNQVRRWLGGRR